MAAAVALAKVHQALQWIGFGNQVHRDSICEEAGFESLEDFCWAEQEGHPRDGRWV